MLKTFSRYVNSVLTGMQLRHKLLMSYLLFILIPLGMLSFVSYNSFSKIIKDYVFFSVQSNFNLTYSYLSDKLYKVITTSEIVMKDDKLSNIFLRDFSQYSAVENNVFITEITNYLSSFEDNSDIYRVRIYVPDENLYSEPSYYFRNMKDIESKKWYKAAFEIANLAWCPSSYFDCTDFDVGEASNAYVLALMRKIKDPTNYLKNAGFIRVDFRESAMRNIIEMADSVKGSLTYVQSEGNIPVVTSNSDLYEEIGIPVTQLNGDHSGTVLQPYSVRGEKVYYLSRQFKQSDWVLVTVIPYGEIVAQAKALQSEILILILLISSAAFAFAWYVAFSMTKRISLLKRKMKDVQEGKLNSIIETSAGDEIGELTRSYNYMLGKISKLIEERYKAGIEVKNAELKALQAQINPHFLYNTLDMINWLAQKNRVEDVEQAVNSLAMYYKLSLSKGMEEITIGDELEHVSSYVKIQNMRFSNKICLIIEVDEEIKEYMILKLTLQPIIENAILHGIVKNMSREGTIIIEGRVREEVIILQVQDNGAGMSESNLEMLNSAKSEKKAFDGYGVKNVIDRIKLFYGEAYGLTYTSVLGKGTTVEIRIPAKEPDSDINNQF